MEENALNVAKNGAKERFEEGADGSTEGAQKVARCLQSVGKGGGFLSGRVIQVVKIVEAGTGDKITKGRIESPGRIHFQDDAESCLFHGVHDGSTFGGGSKVDEGGIGVEGFPEFEIEPLLRGADGEKRRVGRRDRGIGGIDNFYAFVSVFGDPLGEASAIALKISGDIAIPSDGGREEDFHG